jgi:hypothetical protein
MLVSGFRWRGFGRGRGGVDSACCSARSRMRAKRTQSRSINHRHVSVVNYFFGPEDLIVAEQPCVIVLGIPPKVIAESEGKAGSIPE